MKRTVLWKMTVVITAVLFPAAVVAYKPPDDAKKDKILEQAYRIQVPFIENMGQVISKDVSFYAKTFGGTIFVENNGCLTYSLPAKNKKGVVIKEVFTDKTIKIKGLEPSTTRVNYFKGKDKSHWKTNIPTYGSLALGEICNGIDLTLKAYGNNVEKLFTVLPEKNPKIIRIKVTGAKGLKVNKKGELEVITELGSLRFTKPFAYQNIGDKKKPVEVAYVVHEGNTYGFDVGRYDKKRPLIIDPLLASTFVGGGDSDYVYSIALDGSGDVYVAGQTSSSNYPITSGAYDESYNGGSDGSDVLVSKLDSNLSTLLASTFIGGGDSDYVYSIALDESGDVSVAGGTDSSDYPTTPGAYDESHNGGIDVFVSKLDSDLSTLLASTFIGGDSYDYGCSIALGGSENVYVAGCTSSSDYPTTSGAYDQSHNDYYDVFVSKLDSDLSSLLASTFIGGGINELIGYSIALDGSENVYVTGYTDSSDYPTTPGAYDESYDDSVDAFVSKLDSTLSTLLASTFIGGDGSDYGRSIAIDGSGNAYVAGYTGSSDYPTTSGAYDESHNGVSDVFVSKFDSTLSALLASTFIGGDNIDLSWSIALDESWDVYLTGRTQSSDYPTTSGAYDESHNGGPDVFVSKLDSTLSALLASTFIGGGGSEDGFYSIVLDGGGDVYVAGYTSSSDYPTTSGAYDESHNGYYDVFVSKLDGDLLGVAAFTADPTSGVEPLTVQFTDESTGPITAWSWDFGDSETSSEENSSHEYQSSGDYTVTLTVAGSYGEESTKTEIDYIHVVEPAPVAEFTADPTSGTVSLSVQFTDQSTGSIGIWEWDFDNNGTIDSYDQSPVPWTYTAAGDYTVTLTVTGPGGPDTETKIAYIHVSAICHCELVPDATVIQRGGTLGFQVSVTNNTGGMGTVLLGTKVTKPDASQTGFIWGPLEVYLNPHQTKSGHKTHTIPGGFELGMYTYHGYVGRYGNIYDECQFDFEVVP